MYQAIVYMLRHQLLCFLLPTLDICKPLMQTAFTAYSASCYKGGPRANCGGH